MKQQLLAAHTLEAAMSMPDELFHDSNAGVVTCALVITAHVPHPEGKKTWFAYWKDDAHVKVKNKGRIDKYGQWEATREEWVNSFRNRDVKKDYSLMQQVSAGDEWCVEAYMETDYSLLTQDSFIDVIRNFVIYDFLRQQTK